MPPLWSQHRNGRPASEILGEQGETNFHQCLSDILTHQIKIDNIIVTTDDSIICSEKNCHLLSNEFTVYLKVSTSVQLERIGHNRPLLPTPDYKAFLDNLHQERDALYEQVASLCLNSDENALEKHVESIIKAITK